MNFTREPIIESVITPREGYNLTLRRSRGGGEEITVDAVEIVSFSGAIFYRSMERPKNFLLPVSDYEVVETKETRVVLKNATIEKNIKIAGGKQKEEEGAPPSDISPSGGRERHRRRRGGRGRETPPQQQVANPETVPVQPVSQSMFRSLFPPPSGLISEKYKKPEESSPVLLEEKTVEEISKDDPTFPGIESMTTPLEDQE